MRREMQACELTSNRQPNATTTRFGPKTRVELRQRAPPGKLQLGLALPPGDPPRRVMSDHACWLIFPDVKKIKYCSLFIWFPLNAVTATLP